MHRPIGPYLMAAAATTALDEHRFAEHAPNHFAQGLRPIDDHQHTPIDAQAATLEICEQASHRWALARRLRAPLGITPREEGSS